VDVSEILAMDIDGDDAWIAVRRPGQVGEVIRLDLRDGRVLGEYPVSLPAAVRIASDRVWVASYLTNELLGFAR
jgi:outer membrane protein assembly factor BamB